MEKSLGPANGQVRYDDSRGEGFGKLQGVLETAERIAAPARNGVHEWIVQGDDGDIECVGDLLQVMALPSVPAVIHHDLDALEAGLFGESKDPVQTVAVERAGRKCDQRTAQRVIKSQRSPFKDTEARRLQAELTLQRVPPHTS